MNKDIDLSIIIVSFNSKEFLKTCIDSIRENISDNISYEIIVVDNASTDGTVEEIQNSTLRLRSGQEFKIISNKRNMGFSKANNIGVKQSEGSYLLFLNPDTIVFKNSIETMMEFLDKNQEVGAVTERVELPNGELDDACHRGFPTPWNSFCYFSGIGKLFPKLQIFNGYHLGFKDLNKNHEIDACCGACIMVRKKAGEEIGWWDEDYFFYGEDLDFCYRLKQKNWKIYFLSNALIRHFKGVSSGIKKVSKEITTADGKTISLAQKERFEAMRIFYKKHYEKIYPKYISWLVYLAINLKEKL